MNHLFFIVDTSGSMIDDYSKIGQINDLLRDTITTCIEKELTDIKVITYSDDARVYWSFTGSEIFYDIPDESFVGRSNLGKAYELLKSIIENEKLPLEDCMIILISDGEATDNYKKKLELLDKNKSACRIAISIGNNYDTTEKHASNNNLMFKKGIDDRDNLLDRVIDLI